MNVFLPRETVSDDAVRLLQIHVSQGQAVEAGELLFTFESSKSVFDVEAPSSGKVQWQQLIIDEFYPVAEAVAAIVTKTKAAATSESQERASQSLLFDGLQVRSKEAEIRLAAGERPATRAQQFQFLSSRDFESPETPPALPRSPSVSQSSQAMAGDSPASVRQPLDTLRQRMKTEYQRHVPTGTLLNDRWQLAQQWGFGEGASCYDECLILGDVRVGKNCWIGPFTILDGAHAPLTIGDRSSIGAGTHVYTHDTIARTLVGEHVAVHQVATVIGKNCFVAPNVVIAPGTRLGDHCFVAAGAYVQGVFSDNSYIAGNPAVRAGEVEISDSGFRIRRGTETPR